jgi:hypothetical protein
MISNNAFVVGDIHGCFGSFIDLLNIAKVNIDTDQIVSVGDIIDKGPQTLEALRFAERYGVLTVLGNHEEKFARLAKGNKVKINAEITDTQRQLGDEWHEWGLKMGTWPLYLPFEDDKGNGYIVHGGVGAESHFDEIDKQPKNYLLRMRTYPFTMYVRGEPLSAPLWQDAYNGRLGTIIHGHIPLPSVHSHGNNRVFSLDGGCVYGADRAWGGCIRGVRLGSREVFEAPGKPEYTLHYNSLE